MELHHQASTVKLFLRGTLADEKFLRFDDVGNLKTRVTLIESGKKVEGGDEDHPSTVRVRVIGSPVSETIFRVREVTVE